MHPPDDLEEYLRGDSALSRQYRRESAPAPPHALDRRVLKFLREPLGSPTSLASRASHTSHASSAGTPYLAPLAFAASVLLSVALVLAIAFGPQSVKRIDDSPRLVRAAVRADTPPQRLYSSDPKLARSRSVWLGDIAALRRAGRNRERTRNFAAFAAPIPTM